MSCYRKICFFLLITIQAFAQIGGRTQVAVMTFEASGIEASAIATFTDRFRSELLNTGRFDVMERGRMDEILKEQGFQQAACSQTECLVQAGQMLGVARMIAGTIGKVGKLYTVSARIIDVETGRIMINKNVDCTCAIEQVLQESLRDLARQLAGLTAGQAGAQPQPVAVNGTGDFYFKSDPPGATVFIDDKPVNGVTPNSVEGAQAGMHTIRMETDEYSASENVFLEPNEFKRVELKLTRARGGIKVLSQPYEAAIFIDEKAFGLTPQTITDLETGEHAVRLTKDGYMDHSERVRIKGNEVVRLEVTLTKWALLTVTCNVSDAAITVNGALLGRTPLQSAKVEPGNYEIRVRKDGYAAFITQQLLVSGQTATVSAALQKPAALQVNSDPAGATVFIDGASMGNTPVLVNDLAPGTHKVVLTSRTMETWGSEVNLIEGQTASLSPTLTMKRGALRIIANVNNAQVLLDGKAIGTTPLTKTDVLYGSHKILVQAQDYKPFESTVELYEPGPVSVDAALTMAMATLDLSAITAQKIILDDEPIGSKKVVEITPGSHNLVIKSKGYETTKCEVQLAAGGNTKLEIPLIPKSRAKAMLRSLALPGLGQAYSDRSVAAVAYPLLQAAAIGVVFLLNNNYNKAIDDYQTAHTSYGKATEETDIVNRRQQMDSRYADISSKEKTRNLSIGIAAGLWLWNAVDAFIWGPHTDSKNIGSLDNPSLHFYCTNYKERCNLGVQWKF
jgi:hypothetical protein